MLGPSLTQKQIFKQRGILSSYKRTLKDGIRFLIYSSILCIFFKKIENGCHVLFHTHEARRHRLYRQSPPLGNPYSSSGDIHTNFSCPKIYPFKTKLHSCNLEVFLFKTYGHSVFRMQKIEKENGMQVYKNTRATLQAIIKLKPQNQKCPERSTTTSAVRESSWSQLQLPAHCQISVAMSTISLHCLAIQTVTIE